MLRKATAATTRTTPCSNTIATRTPFPSRRHSPPIRRRPRRRPHSP
ncbi:hypothetical protein CsSME_00014520 [Camellia sinensis var. sinensis]